MENRAKQVIVIRKDLNMRRGKMVAQGSHASMAVLLDLMQKWDNGKSFNKWELTFGDDSMLSKWLKGDFVKICVSVDGLEELNEVYEKARRGRIPCSYIEDSGLTEFHGEKTPTCIAIGPWDECEIDEITGNLKLL